MTIRFQPVKDGHKEWRCPKCETVKPVEDFYWSTAGHTCKKCQREYQRAYLASPKGQEMYKRIEATENRKKARRKSHLKAHGVTVEQYDLVLLAQENACAICGATEPGSRWGRFAIDHDHNHCPGLYGCTDCFRGLLCHSCNTSLGGFRDDVDLLNKAISYLEKTKKAHEMLFGSV